MRPTRHPGKRPQVGTTEGASQRHESTRMGDRGAHVRPRQGRVPFDGQSETPLDEELVYDGLFFEGATVATPSG